MIGVLPLEIREFPSLNELSEYIEKEITWYETLFKEYSEKLGSLLRKHGYSSEEIERILREKGLTRQAAGGKGKKGKPPSSEGWFSYKGLLFSADKQGQAEILFESIENAEKIISKMKEARSLIEELQKIGFGPGLAFSVYFVNGVPEKIYVRKAEGATRKYRLELFLSTSMEAAPAPQEEVEAQKTLEDQEAEGRETVSEEEGSGEDEAPADETGEKNESGGSGE